MVKWFACLAVGVLVGCLVLAGGASAVTPAADWSIRSLATPTDFSTGDNAVCEAEIGAQTPPCDAYVVLATNTGSVPTEGSVTLTDTVPAGLTVQRIALGRLPREDLGPVDCEVATVRCVFPEALAPDGSLRMTVYVTVGASAARSLTNTAGVSGGGAEEVSTSLQNTNGAGAPPFGPNAFGFDPVGVDGATDTQAGAHPYELGTSFDFNSVFRIRPEIPSRAVTSVHDVRDVVLDLPLGFVGSALAAPTCTLAQLASALPPEVGTGDNNGGCPSFDTRLGHIQTLPEASLGGVNSGIFNLVSERGLAAQFGFTDIIHGTHALDTGVIPTPRGYVLRTTTHEIPQIDLTEIIANLFGDPAVRDGSSNTPVAQFTNPSDCTGEPLTATVHVDSWQAPGAYNPDGTPDFSDPNWSSASTTLPPVTGCDLLRFTGSATEQPETTSGDTPTGFGVEFRVPQSETPETLATPPLKKSVVTLPVGMSINPAGAGGLESCSLAQVGMSPSGEPDASQPTCPEASKVATVEVETPAIAGVLQGSVYLATQDENPFGALLAGYIVVDDHATGLLMKIPGRFELDPVTGQITTVFDDAPQFPVSDLRLHFFGGPRAALTTPAGCGTYTTNAELTPWSAPDSGPPVISSSSFQITGGCAGAFAPVFTAGTTDDQAGAFSALTTTFSRQPGEQNLSGVTVTTPPGVLAILEGVERCPEPQASRGTCGPNSLIGHTTVAAGSGPDPFWDKAGQVFLTGPYKGAPFGLSVVVPTVAGPFNLGNVVTRAAIDVDPHTAQITVTSDPLPTILQGIPLDVRTVNVAIDRPGFMFDPTNCEPLAVTGSLSSSQGASVAVSSRFQAANCQGLSFKPVFDVSTQAKTSKHNGASLTVKGSFPTGEANIHSVAVVLPKQLPARLTTIQQACPEATFDANPATCPTGSMIGAATATTPILADPVVGPAYLVSHGGAAFPNVVAILQGEGVTVDLVGSVNIKKGITSSDFATVPDAPISTFQLSLPEGPHSGLAAVLPAKAKGDMCGTSLSMPFTITGQNGAQVRQNVKIAVTGCPKPKKKTKAKAKHKAKRK